MNLVSVGIGGTGAACVETLVHLAAIGLIPDGWRVVPAVIDPDELHPRIRGMTTFVSDYEGFRQRGAAKDLSDATIFGTPIIRDGAFNHLRPARKSNLFELLEVANPAAVPLAYSFFTEKEIGGPGTNEFANGFYGLANAGVCFFSDVEGKRTLLRSISQYLQNPEDRLVIFGSAFGGTGAAGMLNVARAIRDAAKEDKAKPSIAIVMLEKYFEPDSSKANNTSGPLNEPSTFLRRTGSAYRFLHELATRGNLPCDALYPLGVKTPETYPPEWFKRDQQDNPHLFIEYLAALAARDFAVNHPGAARSPVLRVRRVALPPFQKPDDSNLETHLDRLRDVLYGAAVTSALLEDLVLPLIKRCQDDDRLPGHPWVNFVITRSNLRPPALLTHFSDAAALLRSVLGHAGVLPAEWRFGGARDVGDDDRKRAEEMSKITRRSFPKSFVPFFEHMKVRELLSDAIPTEMFDGYDKRLDHSLPVRALHRWVMGTPMRLPSGEGNPEAKGQAPYQLVQQETTEPGHGGAADSVVGVVNITDDNFAAADNTEDKLKRLANARWEPAETSGEALRMADGGRKVKPPTPSEYPTIWAPALTYPERIYGKEGPEDDQYLHLGLLWVALMPWGQHTAPPIFAVKLGSEERSGKQSSPEEPRRRVAPSSKVPLVLSDTIRTTCPLSNYERSVAGSWTILLLHDCPTLLASDMCPEKQDILGYFYPDSIIVPSSSLAEGRKKALIELGRHVAGKGFAQLLHGRYKPSWFHKLEESGVPNPGNHGLLAFLASFDQAVKPGAIAIDQAYRKHDVEGCSAWINYLYEAEFRA